MPLDEQVHCFFEKSKCSFVHPGRNRSHLQKLSLLGRCPRTNALKQIECFLDFALVCLVAVKSCLSEVLKIPPLLSQALFPQAHEIGGQALGPGLGAAGTFACIH